MSPKAPTFCSVDDCGLKVHARSLCRSHYFEKVERPRDPRYNGGDSLAVASASQTKLGTAGERTLDEIESSIRGHLNTFVQGTLAAVEARIAVGHDLLEARERFGENDKGFGQWCKGRFSWDKSWRRLLMLAAENEATVRTLLESQLTSKKDLNFEKLVLEAAATTKRAESIEPGDVVEDDFGDAREITAVEEHGEEIVLHDSNGDALVAAKDKLFKVIPKRIGKTDYNGVSHPAVYSDVLLPVFAEVLKGHRRVLDPFAGVGRIHELRPEYETVGVELEPEWATMSEHTIQGNALALPFADGEFDAICTSPTYGNRLADHHEASDPESRRSYTHDLGRKLHEENSGSLPWGDEYRSFHERAWKEADRVLRPGGVFVVNIKDHIRGGVWQDVTGWHLSSLTALGFRPHACRPVVTPSLKQGTNSELRVDAEMVLVFYKAMP